MMKGMNVLHHRLSQEDIREAGYDTGSLVNRRYAAAMQEEIRHEWNTSVKRWGNLWYSVNGVEVTAGLAGCMSGIVIARFEDRTHATNFGDDFVDGKVFCLMNNDLWMEYVRDAHRRRPFDSDRYLFLVSTARTEGQTLLGEPLGQRHLQIIYGRGERV